MLYAADLKSIGQGVCRVDSENAPGAYARCLHCSRLEVDAFVSSFWLGGYHDCLCLSASTVDQHAPAVQPH